jgi:hypothetical protein
MSLHSVDSTSSLFSQGSSLSQSVWTDSGLPGVDLGVGVTRLAAGGLAAAASSGGAAARAQQLWAGLSNGGLPAGPGNGTASAALAGPPPGFGGAAAGPLAGSRLAGSYQPLTLAGAQQQQHQPLGGLSLPPGFGNSGGLYRPFA